MDVAVTLGIFQVNFGILAVRRVPTIIPYPADLISLMRKIADSAYYNSIPLLRPFYRRYKQKMSSSRLNEGTGEGTSDRFKDGEASAGSRNKSRVNKIGIIPTKSYAAGALVDDTWEMNDYTTSSANNANKSSDVDNSVEDTPDDRGSEKRLTSPSQLPASQISVRTDWTISGD
ncbi:hypothetical protein G7Y89_g12328 [Cudoniella acicularis]|uniref:Uncharacterized protein n=1 Tax=Cudoniella acicularis TaxID=354080 RepID=A0A8H4RC22_9HELO|nr:hypothetical protein G7Y89_g12328 [Cudoniella acicularis]